MESNHFLETENKVLRTKLFESEDQVRKLREIIRSRSIREADSAEKENKFTKKDSCL